jgi:hypothetical protein
LLISDESLVENLQVGRLDDCIQHYTVLQNNLVQLATELDNYPTEENDPYEDLNIFPDEIMRKDILENYLTIEEKASLQSPLIPACELCCQNNVLLRFLVCLRSFFLSFFLSFIIDILGAMSSRLSSC